MARYIRNGSRINTDDTDKKNKLPDFPVSVAAKTEICIRLPVFSGKLGI